MISAKVVADSVNEFGNRLTTLLVVMPRIILAEFNTHRMLSKNSASSRAIPTEKLLKTIEENPFIPIAWQKNHSGMQGTEYLEGRDVEVLISAWLQTRNLILSQVRHMAERNPTKQIINRPLETFMYHTVLVSATEWENFFALRCPQYKIKEEGEKFSRSWKDVVKYYSDKATAQQDLGVEEFAQELREYNTVQRLQKNKAQAEIHMMATAEVIWDAMNESTPKQLKGGEWHIPFGDTLNGNHLYNILTLDGQIQYLAYPYDEIQQLAIKVATARAARTSYTTLDSSDLPDTKEQYKKDIELHDRLSTSGHWSPFEHCARSMTRDELEQFKSYVPRGWSEGNPKRYFIEDEHLGICGNFRGFIQYRKMFQNENITK